MVGLHARGLAGLASFTILVMAQGSIIHAQSRLDANDYPAPVKSAVSGMLPPPSVPPANSPITPARNNPAQNGPINPPAAPAGNAPGSQATNPAMNPAGAANSNPTPNAAGGAPGNGVDQPANSSGNAGAATNNNAGNSASNTSPTNADKPVDPLASSRLTLADVVASVTRAFPVIEQARLQGGVAGGDVLSANGFYDHKLQGYTLSDPTGVYRNYRQGIGVARQLWWGGYLSAGYRLGRGDFEPWYKERETDKSGEFKLGLVQPLLQGRAIDPARVALFQANLRQQAVGPEIERVILISSLEGSIQYWNWVASGSILEAQRELLELAETRAKQLTELNNRGRIQAVDLLINEQLVYERQVKVIESEQKLRANSFKLSLYLRDEAGLPLVPGDDWLPRQFPTVQPLPPGDFNADITAAMLQRPEPRLINLEVAQVNWDNQLARNQTLPQLDFVTEGSQDAGDPASSANDKSRFELEIGLQGELPIQRRKARGKIISTNAKIAQLQQKLQLQRDKIGAELQTARNALDQAQREVVAAEAALRSAINTLDAFNRGFQIGKYDLVYLNLLESKANEYEIKLIESQFKWFAALAEMQAALGLDPLEQSIQVSSLPPAKTPSPRNLPEPVKPAPANAEPKANENPNPAR